jgi:hypothetical protein
MPCFVLTVRCVELLLLLLVVIAEQAPANMEHKQGQHSVQQDLAWSPAQHRPTPHCSAEPYMLQGGNAVHHFAMCVGIPAG